MAEYPLTQATRVMDAVLERCVTVLSDIPLRPLQVETALKGAPMRDQAALRRVLRAAGLTVGGPQ